MLLDKFVVLILMFFATVTALIYLTVGKIKNKPFVPANALWIFYLIEKMFDDKEVKENGLSQTDQW
ncbi:MAG: hypothetical protein AMJ89_04055 [candidate division Zixibacteria bacterium SM23_73]|nr:MAG: hypothetical protein AMJ89_04055 [candidate division Zixibacteria bacterium SM23_73]